MKPEKLPKLLILMIFLSGLLGVSLPSFAKNLPLDEAQAKNWARFYEEHQTHKYMMDLSARFKSGPLVIREVTLIPMTEEVALENQTVLIQDGKISAIGSEGEVDIPTNAIVITNAAGKFMIPGLTEGHAHTQFSLSQFLVYLTRGITTVREMDGFPWMLKARTMATENDLLIPNLYVAGHILSNRAWDFFMTQIDTEEEAREAVKAQAQAGYDFIKIHNSMPEPMFSAIFEEAHRVGLDVVGHIPNEITIKHAIEKGMRTNEHFKGYIYDMTLQITTQDYLTYTAGSELWNAPSFSNYHEHLRGDEALKVVIEENSLRLVPRWMKKGWIDQAAEPMNKLTELRQTILPKSKEIFINLLQYTDKFFAGTDTGNYAFMVPGYALQEEVRIFEDVWFGDPYLGLKTATINPALAMRKEAEMGTLEVGKRADFVILNNNPLEGTKNLAGIWGVGLRGIWLHKDILGEIENTLEGIFSDENTIPEPSEVAFETLVLEMEALKESGFPYPDYSVEEIENLFKALGFDDLAGRVDTLQVQQGGPIQTP